MAKIALFPRFVITLILAVITFFTLLSQAESHKGFSADPPGSDAVIALGGTTITLANVGAGQPDAVDLTFVQTMKNPAG